jgi:hypothetical protein
LKSSGTIDETIDRRLEEKQTTMRRLLEDEEVSVGTFDLAEEEKHDLGRKVEEDDDFQATIDDLKHQSEYSEII